MCTSRRKCVDYEREREYTRETEINERDFFATRAYVDMEMDTE
jgi:hypothetical protein